MRFIKLLLISGLLLFVLITAISLLIPFNVRISRATNIHAPTEKIWEQVDDMNKWKDWNPFFSSLPTGAIRVSDTSGGNMTSMEVSGTMVQWREQKADERIAVMQRKNGKPMINGWKCIQHPGSDSTTLQWYMDFQLRWYPWEKFSSLVFDRSYGPKMEQGLNNIKKLSTSTVHQ